MLGAIAASKAAKTAALCVCPVVGTAALTVSVPQVRSAVHKMTAPKTTVKPRQYAKSRVRPPVQTAQAIACPDPVPVMLANNPLGVPMTPMDSAAFDFAGPGRSQLASLGPIPVGGVILGPVGGGGGGTPGPGPIVGPLLPEPGTWAQMIAGFGAIGGVIRWSKRGNAAAVKPQADLT